MTSKRLLLVDDNQTTRSALGQLLREEGFTVTIVDDGKQALAALREGPFDLVISDLEMARLHAVELILQLKHDQPELPVMVINAAGNGAARQAKLLGAVDYVHKPIVLEDFLARLHRILGGA